MAARENTVHLEDWCATVEVLLRRLEDGPQRHLYDVLRELTMDELQFGHITGPSVKFIQKSVGPFNLRKMFECLRFEDPRLVWTRADYSPVQLRGWREIALFLRMAPPTVETLHLLDLALEIHERPLAQAFADVLSRYESPSVIIKWLEKLFAGRHSRKILLFDILSAMIIQCHFLGEYFVMAIDRCMFDPTMPEIVVFKAMRAHRAVLALSLPSSIIETFGHPVDPVVRYRKEWGGKSPIPVSVSLSFKKPGSNLPFLDVGGERLNRRGH